MDIEIEMTRDDYINFNDYVRSKKIYKKYRLFPLILLFIWVFLINIKKTTSIVTIFSQYLIAICIYYIIIFVLKPINNRFIKNMLAQNGNILGIHKFKIEDEGFREITEHSESLHKWSGIQSIETNKKYIFVFIDIHMAHIIPKRYFSSENECSKFVDKLKEKASAF